MQRFFQGLTVVFAVVGLSSAQARSVGGLVGGAVGYAAPSEEILRCLSEDLPVAVKVDYSVMTHPMVTMSTFYLKVGLSGATVSGRSYSGEDPVRLSPRRLSRAEGERILRDLTSAMLRREAGAVTASVSVRHGAFVEWACGAVETKRGVVELTAHVHDSNDKDAEGSYSRVLGVRDVVVKALRQAHR
ncbi:hypothetical protein [Myxococcus hansupus]|uniref:hypothetical protein n=1 Tax=Pseudomyxococcus hansupus TaxID=1297742 RepID=UPI00027302D4|nr:hypothetical protein [Myxococcus hansupus]